MSATDPKIRELLDWSKLGPLRLRARFVADGVYAGGHRSPRRGTGVEFGGHRPYVPGDDLRWLDRHALMRHGRLLVRQFETETDRALHLLVDASASMGFRSPEAPGAKLSYGAVIAAALARLALAEGDPVALSWLGGQKPHPLPPLGGREAFERVVAALENAEPGGDISADKESVDRVLVAVAQRARRGAIIVLLSDLLDLPAGSLARFASLATLGRTLIAVRILDPLEAYFTFDGPMQLRSSEGDIVVETDTASVRTAYLAALERTAQDWEQRLLSVGGRLVRAVTNDNPVRVVREVVLGARGGAW